jgi:hypothetical protein
MLSSHKIDYKLSDIETDDIGEKMNIEVVKLSAQMVTLRVETAAQGEQLRAQLNAQMVTLRVETAAQLRAQGEQLRALQGTVLFDFIRNVISTILLVFAGEQPHKNTESHRFYNAKGPFLSRITEYVKGSNWDIKKFKIAADGVISRRNRAFHPVSVQELDELVTRAKEAIHTCPSIRTDLRNECIILDDYDDMKRIFPVL